MQLGETRCGQTNEGGELQRESRAGSWKLGTGESRGLGNEGSQELGGHWESREETWDMERGKRKIIRKKKTNKQ